MTVHYLEAQPDYFLKDYSAQEYDRILQKLSENKSGVLFLGAQGLDIVGKVALVVESVRGWCGFVNRASIVRVNSEMLKFLYYGVCNDFMQEVRIAQLLRQIKEERHTFRGSRLTRESFTVIECALKVASSPQDKSTSLVQIRQELCEYHQRHERELKPCFWSRVFFESGEISSPVDRAFGRSFLDLAGSAFTNNRRDLAAIYLQKAIKYGSHENAFQDLLERFFDRQAYSLPQAASLIQQAGIAAYKNEDYARAKNYFERGKKSYYFWQRIPRELTTYLGATYLQLHDWQSAKPYLAHVANEFLEDIHLIQLLAKAYTYHEDYEDAILLLRRLERLDHAHKDSYAPELAQAYLDAAGKCLQMKKWQGESMPRFIDDAHVKTALRYFEYVLRSGLQISRRCMDIMAQCYSRLSLYSHDSEINRLAGVRFFEKKQIDVAMSYFKRAIEQNPSCESTKDFYRRCLRWEIKKLVDDYCFKEALAYCQAAETPFVKGAFDAEKAFIYRKEGDYYHSGTSIIPGFKINYQLALQAYWQAFQINSEGEDWWHKALNSALHSKAWKEAILLFEKAPSPLQECLKKPIRAYMEVGQQAASEGCYSEAMDAFEAILSYSPLPLFVGKIVASYVQQFQQEGRLNEAILRLKKMVGRFPLVFLSEALGTALIMKADADFQACLMPRAMTSMEETLHVATHRARLLQVLESLTEIEALLSKSGRSYFLKGMIYELLSKEKGEAVYLSYALEAYHKAAKAPDVTPIYLFCYWRLLKLHNKDKKAEKYLKQVVEKGGDLSVLSEWWDHLFIKNAAGF